MNFLTYFRRIRSSVVVWFMARGATCSTSRTWRLLPVRRHDLSPALRRGLCWAVVPHELFALFGVRRGG